MKFYTPKEIIKIVKEDREISRELGYQMVLDEPLFLTLAKIENFFVKMFHINRGY